MEELTQILRFFIILLWLLDKDIKGYILGCFDIPFPFNPESALKRVLVDFTKEHLRHERRIIKKT